MAAILLLIGMLILTCLASLCLYFSLHYPQYIRYFLAFSLPLSIHTPIVAEFSMELPSEILLTAVGGALALSSFFSLLHVSSTEQSRYSIFRTPLTWIILADLFLTGILCFYSELPSISLKRFLIKSMYIWVFYYGGTRWISEKKESMRLLDLYLLGFIVVIFYTLYRHAEYNFTPFTASQLSQPFFAEHTIYGATLVFLLPYGIWRLVSHWSAFSYYRKTFAVIGVGVLLFSLISSASRAAWVSMIVIMGLYIVTILSIPYKKYVLSTVFVGIIILGIYFLPLSLQSRAQSNNLSGNILEHFASISNIEDVSNKERINRWVAAIEMVKQKPVTGWGPGTFAFCYAPFQKYAWLTQISTRIGNKGNAHSEWFTYLAEYGFLGLILYIVFWGIGLYAIVKEYFRPQASPIMQCLIGGLVAFGLHSFFNTFSDQIEMAALIYTALAAISLHPKQKILA